jgi:integrase
LYVLFAKDSGLRAQDLLSLCYRHVKKDLEKGEDYVHLELEPAYYNRKKTAGITFIGPDTVRLLKQLINNRTVKTETDAKIFPFKYSSMFEALQLAKMKGNLDRKIQPSHGLRKFFEQSLDRVGMDVHKKLQLEGHTQGVRTTTRTGTSMSCESCTSKPTDISILANKAPSTSLLGIWASRSQTCEPKTNS